jgi:hypothetical protein
MTTYTIHFRPGRDHHGVWFARPEGSGYNGGLHGVTTVEAAVAEQVRRMLVYGWTGTVRVIEVAPGGSFGRAPEVARVEVS